MNTETFSIKEPAGKLGILIPGLGAVGTTFIAGVESVIQKQHLPYGSLTQMGTIRLGNAQKTVSQGFRISSPFPEFKISFSAHGTSLRIMATSQQKKPVFSKNQIWTTFDQSWNPSVQ